MGSIEPNVRELTMRKMRSKTYELTALGQIMLDAIWPSALVDGRFCPALADDTEGYFWVVFMDRGKSERPLAEREFLEQLDRECLGGTYTQGEMLVRHDIRQAWVKGKKVQFVEPGLSTMFDGLDFNPSTFDDSDQTFWTLFMQRHSLCATHHTHDIEEVDRACFDGCYAEAEKLREQGVTQVWVNGEKVRLH